MQILPSYGFLGGGGGGGFGVGLGFSLITSGFLSFCAKHSGMSAKPNETNNIKLIIFFAITIPQNLYQGGMLPHLFLKSHFHNHLVT